MALVVRVVVVEGEIEGDPDDVRVCEEDRVPVELTVGERDPFADTVPDPDTD